MATGSFVPAPFFGLRTALLPWQAFAAWTGEPSSLDPEASRPALRVRLRHLLSDPLLREALFLASPELDEALDHWVEAPDSQKGARAERALVRYFSRMCGRSTPFGLFAGCSVGQVGQRTDLRLSGRETYLRHTRLDMDYLCGLAETLAQDPNLRQVLRYRPNSSLYAAGGGLRYAEARRKDKTRSYHLVAVAETPYLLETLRRAEQGATLRALAEALTSEEVGLEEAEGYLLELIESQLLVADLHPAVTGAEPIHDLIEQLAALPVGREAAARLERAREALVAMDAAPLGLPRASYLGVAEELRALPAKVELKRLFQTDLVKPAPEATLGSDVLGEIARGVDWLHRLFGGPGRDPLQRFREAFRARYEGREVPLVEALDEESGIGFDALHPPSAEVSPLLDGLAFPGPEGEGAVVWGRREAHLLNRVVALLAEGGGVLRLADDDLERMSAKAPLPLPESFSALVGLAAASPEALRGGEFKVALSSVSGPSGAALLGRFCHGDPVLTRNVMDYLAAEETRQSHAIHAEIVHLPEGRVGNVILRPHLRPFEIPFLGRSGAPEEGQLPVTDLLISVRDGRIVLRSRRLGREVLPRLTTAHNYSARSLGLYRFLCQLQHQGVAGGLGWSWGPLDTLPFLPRVEVGRVVLAKARWRVEALDPLWVALAGAEVAARWSALQAWREERGVPRLVLLADGDNKLPVDFGNPLSFEAFFDLVRKRPGFVLEEFFPGPDDLCAEGPEGCFVHELVVPFTRSGEVLPTQRQADPAPGTLQRSFLPGSEWLFAKLYAGHAGVDRLLRESIAPLVDEVLKTGAADGWFFIRYGDPDWHLRLRFRGNPARLASEVLPKLEALRGPVRTFILDTYDRELERYGGEAGMELSERLFEQDSRAALAILAHYTGDAGAEARWRLCFKGMDLLMTDLGYGLEGKHRVLAGLRGTFLKEFRGHGAFERTLGDRFRQERKALEALLDPDKEKVGALSHGVSLLRERSPEVRAIGASLRTAEREGRLGTSLDALAGSYLHMHANRLLRAAARAQELVIYDFLTRIYASRRAQERIRVPTGA